MGVSFLLNGERVDVSTEPPTRTLLDWLRETRGLTGTKEGCNEGDCGACTVVVSDAAGARALNACILLLPQLHGRSVRTVEGLGGDHPVQAEMVAHHGSQCGFCTPGIVNSLVAAQLRGDDDHDDVLAGNLCRCTGYAPIVRAAQAAWGAPPPAWAGEAIEVDRHPIAPDDADALAEYLVANPDATIVAGATDIGLWLTKQLRSVDKPIFLNRCKDLQAIDDRGDRLWIGAAVTIDRVLGLMRDNHPGLVDMLRRFGSVQVRGAATIGGNIANGSPIGDLPPALIAMGAVLHLRRGASRRELAIEDFFIDYGRQDRAPGEFVEAVSLPKSAPNLACYKLSKRFDQDISAVCGCFNIVRIDGNVQSARIAFGGMAGTPRRAFKAEQALVGRPWTGPAVRGAMDALAGDFTPLTDMRASARYRMRTAQNMLERYFLQSRGIAADLRGVAP